MRSRKYPKCDFPFLSRKRSCISPLSDPLLILGSFKKEMEGGVDVMKFGEKASFWGRAAPQRESPN